MKYSIFFKDVTSTGDTIISGAITFECIKSFSESRSATVTTHTVEQGFNISDNMNLEPVQFNLDGYVTSYSLLNDREITWDGEKFKTDSVGNKNSKRSPREITWGGDTFKTDIGANNYHHAEFRDYFIMSFKQRSVVSLMESQYCGLDDTEDIGEFYSSTKRGYYKEHENCVITGVEFSIPESSGQVFAMSLKIQQITMAVVQDRAIGMNEAPILQRYKPNTEVSSTTSTSSDSGSSGSSSGSSGSDSSGSDSSGSSDVAGKDSDLSKTLKDIEDAKNKPDKSPDESPDDGGMSWHDGYRYYEPTINKLNNENDMYRKAIEFAKDGK